MQVTFSIFRLITGHGTLAATTLLTNQAVKLLLNKVVEEGEGRRDRAWSVRNTIHQSGRTCSGSEAHEEGGDEKVPRARRLVSSGCVSTEYTTESTCTAKLQLPRAPPYLATAFTPLPPRFSSTVHRRPSN